MKKNRVIRRWVPSLLLSGVVVAGFVPAGAQTGSAPSASTAATQSRVRSELERARAFEQRHRPDLAIPVWKQVLEADPRNAEAFGGLARAAAQSGDFTLASLYVERLRVVNPGDPAIATVEKLRSEANASPGKTPALAWRGPSDETPKRTPAATDAAYQALNAKRITEAESGFRAVLAKHPHDSSAQAGMGFVRLEQRNYAGAISYLEQAKRSRPGDQSVVDALQTARYRFILSEGDASLAANDIATAEKRYRSALDLRRGAEALSGLGQALLARNDLADAIPMLEQAAAAQPSLPTAWRGLVIAQSRLGNAGAAVSAEERMPDAVRTALREDPDYLQALATAQLQAGRGGDAQGSLEAALRLPVSDAQKRSIQMQLAGVLAARNNPRGAEELYAQLTSSGADVSAWQGLIETQHAAGRDDEALASLDRMPAAMKDQAMLQPAFALAVAQVYRGQNRLDMAQNLLRKAAAAQQEPGDRTRSEIAMELARVDVESGQPQQAYPLYQQVLREQPERSDAWAGLLTALHLTGHDREVLQQDALIPEAARAQLQADAGYRNTVAAAQGLSGGAGAGVQGVAPYVPATEASPDVAVEDAWRLYANGNDAALYRELMTLGARSDLNALQRKTVQTIWGDWALRRANLAASQGSSSGALAILNAASEEFGANPEVQRTLAAGFLNAGEAQRATAIFKAQNSAALSAADLRTAITAALSASDQRSADTWLKVALERFPSDPEILLLKGRQEQARGNSSRARQYYQQSLKSMPPEPKASDEPALPVAGLSANSSGQRLAGLLAPESAAAPVLSGPISAPPAAGTPTAAQPTPSTVAAASAGYAPYQSYIAPPQPTVAPNIRAATGAAEVPVQLGNTAAPPVQQQTEMTDVLPTARYVPNNSRPATLASDPNAAAAQAERVRRQRAAEAAQRGQAASNSAAPLVPQPAARPAGNSAESGVSDTGAQQYPQPRTQPPPIRRTAPRSAPAAAADNTPPAAPSAPAVAPVTPPPAPPVLPAVLVPVAPEESSSVMPGLMAAQTPISPVAPRQQVQNALAAIESSYSGFAGVTGVGRFRSGSAGLDRLSDVEAPTELSAMVGHTVRLTAVANPVFLNSGVLQGTGTRPVALPYLGTLSSGTFSVPPQQFSNGLGGEAQVATRAVSLAVGYTPYQFLVHNLTARVRLSPFGERLALYGERQPVRDTQLSYAGLRDPGVSSSTGPVWGGVLGTTGGLRLDLGNVVSRFRLNAEGGVLTGRHVQDNTVLRGTAEADFRVRNWAGQGSLSVGGAFTGMHYQRNEYGLSYGQGGYFSPQRYFAIRVPVIVRGGGNGSFHYEVDATPGVRSFRQDAAAIFPLDVAMQQQFAVCAPGVRDVSCGYYPQVVSTGFDYSVHGEVSYRMQEHWYAGAFVRSSNSNNYVDTSAGFFLRYTFRRQSIAEGRPAGMFATDGLRPLQIP